MGAVPVNTLTVDKRKVRNNKMTLHVFRKYEKEAETLKFLAEDGFTPAVFIHSVIPNFLREAGNLIVLENIGICVGDAQSVIPANGITWMRSGTPLRDIWIEIRRCR